MTTEEATEEPKISKKKVIEQLNEYLAGELSEIVSESEKSGGALSGEQAERTEEIRQLLTMYKFLPIREYGAEDVICPGGMVELELNGIRALYLIVPKGGGLITRVDGRAIQVITPQSPLGEALLGRKLGDSVQVQIAGKLRDYRIVGYY